MEKAVTHDEAAKAALLLRMYCKERFHEILGERGCRECIFSAGERRKRCILRYYLDGIAGNTADAEVNKNYERLTKNEH